MRDTPDDQVSDELSARIREAEEFLWAEMKRLGLLQKEGWRIVQSTRDVEGATEIVLRPIHLRKPAPAGLECVVRVHETSRSVDARCSPPDET